MFLTFEGIDGSGKSTQLELLKKYFIQRGEEVLSLREPGGTPLSERIREVLLNSEDNINPIAELMLFEAARADLVEKVITPALKEGKIVICDRFYDSTTAYQGYGRQLPLEDVIKINKLATKGLTPDLTIYLEVSLKLAKERGFDGNVDRMESSGDEFYKRVLEGFSEIADSEPERVIKIKSNKNIESTHKLIINKIENIVNK